MKKFKSIRETMKEKGLLEDFLRTYKHDPAQKYRFGDFSVATEPMDYMDVSLDPPLGLPPLLLPKAEGQTRAVSCSLPLCTLPLAPWRLPLSLRPACQPETPLPGKARRDP